MKSITVFNNKGGVGKTTLLCNIASYLSVKMGKRVLVIDADPQCNASIYLFGEYYVSELFERGNANTILNIFKPIKNGDGYININEIPIEKSTGFGIDVLIGDTGLSTMEDFLSGDWVDCKNGGIRGLKTTFVFMDLLCKMSDKYDYIFFDVGPSLGAINRVVLLACNYFIMPMSSDIFCLKAIENISKTLKIWDNNLQKGLETSKREYNEYFTQNNLKEYNAPNFLGYVIQQYTAKTIYNEKRPVKAYDKIISQIPQKIEDNLNGYYLNSFDVEKLKIGEIPNFNSLIPLSQLAKKPIYRLESKDGVVGAHFSKVKEYEDVISHIVSSILSNIDSYDKLV